MSIVITHKVSFGRPTIGPKHYVSVGASGWAETFLRCKADFELESFVTPLEVKDLVSNFMDQIDVAPKKKTTWSDVTRYLGRIVGIAADKIPMGAGIAFWGQVVLIEEAGGAN